MPLFCGRSEFTVTFPFFEIKSSNGGISFFSFSVSIQISLSVCCHSGLFLRDRYRQAVTVSLGVLRAALVTTTKGVWGSTPGRIKGTLGGAREDQGCNGWRPRGPRSHGPTPKRTKGALDGAQEDDSSSSSNHSNSMVVVIV